MTHNDAADRLGARIEAGRALAARIDPSMMYTNTWSQTEQEVEKWSDYNLELLKAMFTTDEVANSYFYAAPHYVKSNYGERPNVRFSRLADALAKHVGELESIRGRLELYEAATANARAEAAPAVQSRYRDVHIHIEGSTVGHLNVGQVIGEIETHLKEISGPAADDVKKAIKDLVEAVAGDDALPDNNRREAIENIDFLAATAAEMPDRRKLAVVKAVLAGMGGLLGAGGSAITIWQAAEPVLRGFFGI